MTIRILLTQDNGNTREVCYSVQSKEAGHTLFDRLVAQAFEACYGSELTRRGEGDDELSRAASHYTPEA
jgi:hypothetical protein